MKINVELTGTRPMLVHNIGNSLDKKTGKQKVEYDPLEDAKKCLYLTSKGVEYIPSFNVLASIREAGKTFKSQKGKKMMTKFLVSGLQINPVEIPIISENGWVVDSRPVTISRAKIIRSRPRYDEWKLSFTVDIIDTVNISRTGLREIMEDAGKFQGLCDFRPFFGLFEVTKFEEVKE